MCDLDRLKGKRKAVRSATTKLLNGVSELFKTIDIVTLEILNERLQLITEKETVLNELNVEIEALLPATDIVGDVTTSIEYSEDISLWKQRVKTQIEKLNKVNVSECNPLLTEMRTVKLPKLSIKQFSGDLASWIEFYSQFESAIDKNPVLTKIDKFNYLKSYLIGQAASAVRGLSTTEQNYDAALEILKNRFGNKNTLIQTHMNGLLKLPVVYNSQDTIGLRKLFDKIESQVRNLEGLNVEIETFGNLLVPIILERIPKVLVLEFNRQFPTDYTFNDVIKFLENEIQSRERTYVWRSKFDFNKSKFENVNSDFKSNFKKLNNKRIEQVRQIGNYTTSIRKNCVFCNSLDHEFCEYKSVADRKNILRADNRCFTCFSKHHYSRACRLKVECKYCKSKLHSFLLCENLNEQNKIGIQKSNEGNEVCNNPIIQSNSSVLKSNVLLSTCTVIASPVNQDETRRIVRLLLDNGSERSWCTKFLANSLGLKPIRKESLAVYSFGSKRANEKLYDVVRLKLKSRQDAGKFIEVEVLVTDTITVAPVAVPEIEVQEILKSRGVVLADDYKSTDLSINVLIGGDVFWNIIKSSELQTVNKTITCIPTIFGFTLQGCQQTFNKSSFVHLVSANLNVEADIKVLWDLESLGIRDEDKLTAADKCLIDRFDRDLKFVDGRYETKLLWKISPVEIANNFVLAKKRLDDLRKCFERNEWIANEYKRVIEDQKGKGIIEECGKDINEYFMPHRAVVNVNKDTTKVRIVFNCSSKSKQNMSLNDCLESCPNLNPSVLDILLNFRKFKIAFNGDIEKAFLMIRIDENDRRFLKFLWFSDERDTEYTIMRMNRLPFGCKVSSFILSGTIKFHLKNYKLNKPKAVHMLDSSLYVDDLYSGGESVEEAYELSNDACSILQGGGFSLRKLRSNSAELESMWIRSGLKIGDKTDEKDQVKVLGMTWNPVDDDLSMDVKSLLDNLNSVKHSKRGVLRVAAMIYDPIGFLAPFIVRVKCLLQEIWERGLDWDEELSDDIKKKWVAWCSEVQKLKEIKVRRNCLFGYIKHTRIELHVFCDASPIAYC